MVSRTNTWIMIGTLATALLSGCLATPRTVGAPGWRALEIAPATVAVTIGHAAAFSALKPDDQPALAAWRVLEANGGTVDGAGRYLAPPNPGVFTLQAELQDGSHTTANAKITVVPPPEGAIILGPQTLQRGAVNQTARIRPRSGAHYAWTISGGTLTGGRFSNHVRFDAGSGPGLVLRCRVANDAGDSIITSLEIPLVRALPAKGSEN